MCDARARLCLCVCKPKLTFPSYTKAIKHIRTFSEALRAFTVICVFRCMRDAQTAQNHTHIHGLCYPPAGADTHSPGSRAWRQRCNFISRKQSTWHCVVSRTHTHTLTVLCQSRTHTQRKQQPQPTKNKKTQKYERSRLDMRTTCFRYARMAYT